MSEELLGGKWVIERELGGGGMGRVVKAHYVSTHYPCAIKFLHEQHKQREDLVARFLNEAKLSNRIGHPGVCRVIDVGWTDDELPYLVMEYLEGDSLEDVLLANEGLLTIGEARRIGLRVLEILVAAHAQGVHHRDIKPDNIFVTREGAIKILDFGVAKMPGVDITRVGASLGTLGYMSPEAALGASRTAGPKADVWSVGVTLFRALTGQMPVALPAEGNQLELLRAAATTPARTLSDPLPRCPARLVEIVARMLAFEPEERASAASAFVALAGFEIPPEIASQTAPWVWDPRQASRHGAASSGVRGSIGERLASAVPRAHTNTSTSGTAWRYDSDEGDIDELHERLRLQPRNSTLLHELVEAYLDIDEHGFAAAIAGTLRFLGQASERERELAESLDGAYQLPEGRITRRQWREVLTVSQPSAQLSALLARLWPVLAASRRRSYEDMGLDEARERIVLGEPEGSAKREGLAGWLTYLANVFDIPAPDLIVVDDEPRDFQVVAPTIDGRPRPTLLAGPDAAALQPTAAKAFRCGHALAHVHPYLIAGSILPSSTRLRDAIHGATAVAWPNVSIPAAHAEKAAVWRTIIEGMLLPDRIEALRSSVERVVQMGGDTKAWLRGCQHTAVRVGLLVSGDLDVAAELIRSGAIELREDPEILIDDLVSFSVSPLYLELRRSLKIG